jgi:hypothetical protein
MILLILKLPLVNHSESMEGCCNVRVNATISGMLTDFIQNTWINTFTESVETCCVGLFKRNTIDSHCYTILGCFTQLTLRFE